MGAQLHSLLQELLVVQIVSLVKLLLQLCAGNTDKNQSVYHATTSCAAHADATGDLRSESTASVLQLYVCC